MKWEFIFPKIVIYLDKVKDKMHNIVNKIRVDKMSREGLEAVVKVLLYLILSLNV